MSAAAPAPPLGGEFRRIETLSKRDTTACCGTPVENTDSLCSTCPGVHPSWIPNNEDGSPVNKDVCLYWSTQPTCPPGVVCPNPAAVCEDGGLVAKFCSPLCALLSKLTPGERVFVKLTPDAHRVVGFVSSVDFTKKQCKQISSTIFFLAHTVHLRRAGGMVRVIPTTLCCHCLKRSLCAPSRACLCS
jgi:hypothetical protein